MNPEELQFIEAKQSSDYDIAKELFIEYAQETGIDLKFQNFDKELEQLRAQYGHPYGALIIVKNNNTFIGCAGIRKFEENICELKRMYLKDETRGKGIGKKLLQNAINRARELGYIKMRLDTLKFMTKAIRLYESEDFYEIKPYRYNPIEGTKYFEKKLVHD